VNKKARTRLIIATVVIVAAFAGALIYVTFAQSASYVHVAQLTPSENGKSVKVSGKVVDTGSRSAGGASFVIGEDRPQDQWASTGPVGQPTVNVVYKGQMPATFTAGTFVVVVGTYDVATHTLNADQLQTKCPSKYKTQAESASPQATP
jgi:cytochrome c-type biogenesis protein CcmE